MTSEIQHDELRLTCVFCDLPIFDHAHHLNKTQDAHRECSLRSVMGGIGHLLAHEYWCDQHDDPDAGLTYRQSALLVDSLVHILGVEAVLERVPF